MSSVESKRRALVAGATGLVGGWVVRYLLESSHYDQVIVLVRTKVAIAHSRLQQIQSDFQDLDADLQGVQVDDVFGIEAVRRGGGTEADGHRLARPQIETTQPDVVVGLRGRVHPGPDLDEFTGTDLGVETTATEFGEQLRGTHHPALTPQQFGDGI